MYIQTPDTNDFIRGLSGPLIGSFASLLDRGRRHAHICSLLLKSTLALALMGALIITTGCDSPTVAPNGEAPDAQEAAVTQEFEASAPSGALTSRAPVLTFAGMDEVGTSRLVRTDEAIATKTNTTELVPRHVTTLWWVIFNTPGECDGDCGEDDLFDPDVEASCPYADGSIVDGNGHIRFHDRLTVGEPRNSCLDFFGADDHGLLNPEGAEIHVVVRSHGPIIPELVDEMRSSFAGGCEDFLEAGTVPEEPGECADLQFAVHPSPE
jgi:hypothetical protein